MLTPELLADPVALTRALVDVESVSGNEDRIAGLVEAALRARPHLTVERDGNVLLARRSPPVPFERLEQLLTSIEQRPAPRGAIRLVREGTGQLIDYFLCVTPEGRLVVGQQLWRRDPGSGDYVFERGELARAYSPLEGDGTWTWMFQFAVARESDVTLVARADGDRWPVRFVTISVLGAS